MAFLNLSPSSLILLFLCLQLTLHINLPLVMGRPRCMIVYSVGDAETVKIDIKFPTLVNQVSGEHFSISWRNTENQDVKYDVISSGKYRKELDLVQNVIYEVCIVLRSQRQLEGIEIEYNADNMYHFNQAEIKIPENLLTKEDFKQTFYNAHRLSEVAQTFKSMQKDRNEFQDRSFDETKSLTETLSTISLIEIVIVIGTGAFQFFMLRNYLAGKQYI